VGTRNANSSFTAAYSPRRLFWDGRAGSAFLDPQSGAVLIPQDAALENQALGPLVDTSEMAHGGATLTMVAGRLASARPLALATDVPATVRDWINSRSYPALFEEAFGSADVTAVRVAMAIASYERTLNPTQTPFDAQNGGASVLTQQELQGAQLFNANQCSGCHSGALLSDNNFRYIGVRPVNEDLGRFNVTNLPADRGAFRVPSLRNVELSAPYMHTGGLATLEEVVEFYNRGGDFTAPNKDNRIIPRNLTTQQKAALVAFLRRPLTDPRIPAETGPFARPTLFTESARAATIIGAGTPGNGGIAPLLTAIEPPVLGNQNFTVVLSRALGGATARLVVSSSDPGVQATVPTADFAAVDVTADVDGLASAQLRIPYRSTLLGQTLYGRFYVNDPAAANGLAISPAFRITLFGNADIVMADAFD
jgi:cytochrome c peroxidase